MLDLQLNVEMHYQNPQYRLLNSLFFPACVKHTIFKGGAFSVPILEAAQVIAFCLNAHCVSVCVLSAFKVICVCNLLVVPDKHPSSVLITDEDTI